MEDAFAADIEKEMRGKLESEWRKRMEVLQSEKQQLAQQRQQVEQQRQVQEEELNRRLLSEKEKMQSSLSEIYAKA